MNELQLGLIGAGAIIVIGVVLYNAWQGARVRRRMPRPMPPEVAEAVRSANEDSDERPFIEPAYSGNRPVAPAGESAGASAPGAFSPNSTNNQNTRREPTVGASVSFDERREPTLGGGDTFSEMDPAAVTSAEIPGAAGLAELAREADVAHDAEVSLAGASGVAGTAAAGGGAGAGAAFEAGGKTDGGAKADLKSNPRTAGQPAAPEAMPVQPNTQTISAAPPTWVDHRIDCVVVLNVAGPVTGDKVVPLAQRIRRAGSKPVFIEGQRESDGAWESLQTGTRYSDLRAAVQLANRSGALNELEFSEFVTGVQALADGFDAGPEFPDMMETVAMARELDAFAAQCDAQLSINILSDGAPWSANYVQAVASQDGLLLSRDGTRFVKLDAKQNPVFMLQFGETNFLRDDLTFKGGQMITLLLDVPVADEDILPFRLMCDYAASLSHRIGARVVDDQRRPLPEPALAAIESQLLTLYAKLEQAGITAGSPAARRLFSS
jgi:ZipA, C-terminal FtsZ-binding domain